METDSLKWVGSSCGLHGPYIFYKAFKFYREGRARILSLGDFFLVRCTPEDPICIAELQLLWEERTTKHLLSSSKLYFLPEDTPAGRTVNHGEDEVIGVSEKVILRLEDLVKWTAGDLSGWTRGRRAVSTSSVAVAVGMGTTVTPKTAVLRELGTNGHRDPQLGSGGGGSGHRPTHAHLSSRFSISFRDVLKEKAQIGEDEEERMKVLVLSYPQYCRYRCVLARLRGGCEAAVVTDHIVRALGGIGPLQGEVRILYCRETFQHPTLGRNESVCEHFAPNLKGRPRKRKLSQRRESQDSNQNQNPNQALQTNPQSQHPARTSPEVRLPAKVRPQCRVVVAKVKNGAVYKRVSVEEKMEVRRKRETEEKKDKTGTGGQKTDEQAFLVALYQYMKRRKTPIERIPYLGFKQINLWMMYQTAQKLGGYDQITAQRQWKHVYDELGGHPGSTSAATCTRRHYERLLLPYERYTRGQEDRPSAESRPLKAEPVPIGGSKHKGSSPKCSRTGPAPNQQPQSDTEPQNPEVSDDSEGVHLRGTVRNRKTKEEEEFHVTVKQEETPPTQPQHHDNHDSANHVNTDTDTSLQTNPNQPTSPPDSLGSLCPQEGEPSRGSVPIEASLAPQAPCQTTATGYPLGALEPCGAGGISEREGQTVGPVNEAAKGSSPEPLNTSRGCERSSPNAPSTPYFCGPNSVMSPLAKKKLLSQVCAGGGVPQMYPSATPIVVRCDPVEWEGCSLGVTGTLEPINQRPPAHPASPETAPPVPRPSVIQHAQSFRSLANPEDERKTPQGSEPCPRGEAPLQGQFLPCPVTQSQLSSSSDHHPHRTEPQEVQRPWEEHPAQLPAHPPHGPGCRGEVFYSSPHLQSLYRHTKHRLCQQQQQQQQHLTTQMYSSRNAEGEHRRQVAGSTQNDPDVVIDERYSTPPRAPRGCHGRPAGTYTQVVNHPTDLGLPKTALCKGPFGGHTYPTMQGHCRTSAPTPPGIDVHGKACRALPVHVRDASLAYKAPGPMGMSGMAGMRAHGGLSQPLETVRPPKRPLEVTESSAQQSKARPVSPLRPCRDTLAGTGGCTRVSERQGEEAEPPEPARAVHLNSYSSQGHRHPLHTPHLGGLCPVGTFGAQEACEGPRPFGYLPPHPLAYLKGQGGGALPAMVAPPYVLHALMMQGQLVRSSTPTGPLHQAPSASRGERFGEPVPSGLYPLRPFNPQVYPAVQPSTKL
ncbi:hypothetical protein ACEWY4_021306 [Coilia grayii]|uniref:ARID domain-containing protein n=1 Tax=Coilia grayii TaxID=363190 RepID=A0ABD1J8P2_9TELE